MPHKVIRPNRYNARPRPIGDMNVTPFIDVLLVLLIMLILAIPMPVNVTTVDLPSDPLRPTLPVLDQNTIAIDAADRLSWNGAPVTPGELRAQVVAASALEQEPLLRFAPDALASYDVAAHTIALIKDGGAQSFAFIGNDRYRDF
ncbi:ExbD/TolR family protein [Erythrobacter donghaensis]|uniref:ExbD/TolR family protein n=1 Tax=Erythrobacter donghaensis TaxID=267135 RepID=UPI001FE8C475|nr:biopolymer transporter ExbD [Erythrobacter donghaensis]